MVAQAKDSSGTQSVSEAIAIAIQASAAAAKLAAETWQFAADNLANTTTAVGETVAPVALQLVEQGTENIGQLVTPIAEHPLTNYAAKVPGLSWVLAALGQVDVEKAQKEVEQLRQQYPLDTPEQLAQRIIVDTCWQAARLGLISNLVPPLALTLFAVELAAITALQAEMVYRIAAAYGFRLQEPARRGEVLAIFGLSMGGAGVLKAGLGFVELIPGLGAVVGASSNAALLYSLGYTACYFYQAKKDAAV